MYVKLPGRRTNRRFELLAKASAPIEMIFELTRSTELKTLPKKLHCQSHIAASELSYCISLTITVTLSCISLIRITTAVAEKAISKNTERTVLPFEFIVVLAADSAAKRAPAGSTASTANSAPSW